ncbi:virion structural protein [Cellulophaga phage phi19:3]|uniref:Structural protein n=1 Tax=Cellulophaga phage phi19:3 TaxID=1327971 RepID=R9ZYG9_9CAUD|nr:virion structural protein [Cellulophaga phage phi19:3]AGO47530.1 structural protein [Cellulophaga phage phi19:3]
MAVGTAALIAGGIGAAQGGFQLFQGIKQTKEAKEAEANFERQELENVYEDQGISTIGSNLMREESGRTSASLVDASRNAGIRGVFGAIPKIASQTNSQNRESQLYLDNQVQNRNRLVAQDNQRIQGMQEARDNQELQGIGQLRQTGQENTFSGIRGIGNAGSLVAANMESESANAGGLLDSVKALTPSSGIVSGNTNITGNLSGLQRYQQMKQEEELYKSYLTRGIV